MDPGKLATPPQLSYLALPLFDLHSNQDQCCGVLELLSPYSAVCILCSISRFYEDLELAGFGSTHRQSSYIQYQLERQVDREIKRTLELAIKAVPGLSLAQVLVPCIQCHHTSQCMASAYFASQRLVEYCEYRSACSLHTLHIDVKSNTILCDDTISNYPLAHYARRAGFSLGFAIVLRSHTNHSCVIQFFFEPRYKQDSFMQVLRIIQMRLKNFNLVWQGKLVENSIIANPNGMESIEMLESMYSYKEIFSEFDFTKYLETRDLCCSSSTNGDLFEGWVFCSPTEQLFHERLLMQKKVQNFMKQLTCFMEEPASLFNVPNYYMVQCWAPIMVNDRRCLTTRDQPYGLSCLAKGFASFRKECIKHLYLVDEEAKEDELGPVGRVFRNGHPELLYDICSYSAQEFSMKTYALHCSIRKYVAFPVFDDKHKCVGVIELIGYHHYGIGEGRIVAAQFYVVSNINGD